MRRSADELQVGLRPDRAVVLSDTAEIRDLLHALQHAEPVPPDRIGPQRDALRALEAAGLVVDAAVALPLCGVRATPSTGSGTGALAAPDRAALALTVGDDAARAGAARAACAVTVRAFGAGSGPYDGVTRALQSAGLTTAEGRDHAESPVARAVVGAAVGVGEPDRELFDDWVRDGIPHLVVRLHEGALTLGPFVIPGETACLRCVDAHHADVDPAWPLLVAQYARASVRGRPDGLAEPADTALVALATGWAIRDLCTYAEGAAPSTLGTTVTLAARLTELRTQGWRRHPACGCGWQ